jgi:hypothetical protein
VILTMGVASGETREAKDASDVVDAACANWTMAKLKIAYYRIKNGSGCWEPRPLTPRQRIRDDQGEAFLVARHAALRRAYPTLVATCLTPIPQASGLKLRRLRQSSAIALDDPTARTRWAMISEPCGRLFLENRRRARLQTSRALARLRRFGRASAEVIGTKLANDFGASAFLQKDLCAGRPRSAKCR